MTLINKYSREDLLWEATRRNEDYKRYYYEQLAKGCVDFDPLFTVAGNDRWKMDGEVLDPDISIDLIREKLSNGSDPFKVHPYYFLFKKLNEPAIHHDIPKISTKSFKRIGGKSNDAKFKVDLNVNEGEKLRKFLLNSRDRIIISVDPHTNQKVVLASIKKIRKQALEQIKQEIV